MTTTAAPTTTTTRPAPGSPEDTERRWANARAKGELLVDRVRKLAPDRFWVPSQREGEPGYEVLVVGRHPFCPCPAGQQGIPCAHSAALYILAARQRQARVSVPVPRCQVCHLSAGAGVRLAPGPDGRPICDQCADEAGRDSYTGEDDLTAAAIEAAARAAAVQTHRYRAPALPPAPGSPEYRAADAAWAARLRERSAGAGDVSDLIDR